jgi:hypothetical protein
MGPQPSNPMIQKMIGAETARVMSNFRVDLIVVILSAEDVLMDASPLFGH